MLYAEPVHRCCECGELRGNFGVRFNSMGKATDRCPFCEALRPGTKQTIRFTIRKGLPHPNPTPDREPDFEEGGVEVYVDKCRGDATAEVERKEWEDLYYD